MSSLPIVVFACDDLFTLCYAMSAIFCYYRTIIIPLPKDGQGNDVYPDCNKGEAGFECRRCCEAFYALFYILLGSKVMKGDRWPCLNQSIKKIVANWPFLRTSQIVCWKHSVSYPFYTNIRQS